MPDVKLGLDATLTIDGTELKNVKDLSVSLEKAEADVSTRDNNGWRATVGTLRDASIDFQVVNKNNDTAFATLYAKWLSGDPLAVVISDVGASLALDCEVLSFSVTQNLEDAIVADVSLKPTLKSGGTGINNAAPGP